MMKKLLLCASFLLGMYCASVSAQSIEKIQDQTHTTKTANADDGIIRVGGFAKLAFAPAAPAAKSSIQIKDNELWWGYYSGKYSFDPEDMRRWGVGGDEGETRTYSCCIRLKPESEYYKKGQTIEGIKFALVDTRNIDKLQVFITSELPEKSEDMSGSDICVQDVDVTTLTSFITSPEDCSNEVRFNKPYKMGDKEVYVGFSFHLKNVTTHYDQSPIILEKYPANILGYENAFIRRTDVNSYWREDTENFGILPLKVLLSGDNFIQNALKTESSFFDVALTKEAKTFVPLTLTNMGVNGVKNFKYEVTMDGKTEEKTVELENPIAEVGGKFIYAFPVVASGKSGVFNAEIKVTEVNGAANEAAVTKAMGDAIVVENAANRKVFVEDFTATWARGYGWSYVNKLKLREKYGDKVVIASIHNGADPMAARDYALYIYDNNMEYMPTVDLDRTVLDVYPYLGSNNKAFGFATDLEKALEMISVGSVDVNASLSDDKNSVNLDTNVKFEFTGEKDNYALYYLLTEDGMSDPTWIQTNGMGEYAGKGLEDVEPLLGQFINGDDELTDLVYDDVVIAAKGVTSDMNESISSTIKQGEVQTKKYTFDLTKYPIIQDKTKLNACAVIIDTKSGKVINASQCKVLLPGVNAISGNTAAGSAVEVERYTIDGTMVQAPVKGLNIIKYSDGRVVKSIVK